MQESHSSNTVSETIAVIPSEKQRGMAVRCEVDENGNLIMATCLNVNRSLEITLLAAAACLFLLLVGLGYFVFLKTRKTANKTGDYKSNKLNVTQEQKSAKTTIKALSQTQISNFGSEIESDNEYDNTSLVSGVSKLQRIASMKFGITKTTINGQEMPLRAREEKIPVPDFDAMNFREVEKFLKTAKPEAEQAPLILENNICRDLKIFRDNMHNSELTFRERVALIDRYHKIIDDLDRIDSEFQFYLDAIVNRLLEITEMTSAFNRSIDQAGPSGTVKRSRLINIINKRRRRVLEFWKMIFGNHLPSADEKIDFLDAMHRKFFNSASNASMNMLQDCPTFGFHHPGKIRDKLQQYEKREEYTETIHDFKTDKRSWWTKLEDVPEYEMDLKYEYF